MLDYPRPRIRADADIADALLRDDGPGGELAIGIAVVGAERQVGAVRRSIDAIPIALQLFSSIEAVACLSGRHPSPRTVLSISSAVASIPVRSSARISPRSILVVPPVISADMAPSQCVLCPLRAVCGHPSAAPRRVVAYADGDGSSLPPA